MDSGTLTPLLKKLESKGYIKRTRSASDERNVIISITDLEIELKTKTNAIPSKLSRCINLDDKEAFHYINFYIKLLQVLKKNNLINIFEL